MGKPWMTLFLLFFACFVGGILNSIIMAVIFVGVFTNLCKTLNVAPNTKLPTFLMIGSAVAMLMGQIAVPVMGNALMIMATYNAMFPEPLNLLKYMMFMFPIALYVMAVFVLLMRFVFRVDVSPLKNYDPSMVGGVQKATRDQKMALLFFTIFLVLMVLSSISTLPVAAPLAKYGMFGFIALVLCAMMLLKREDGSPFLNFNVSAAGIGWDPILMVAFIMVISNYMNTAETGISQTIMAVLMPFTQLSPVVFIVVALLFATILTNVATNLIVIVLVMPILYNFAGLVGLNATGLMCLLFVCSHIAIATPAASPVAGICMTAKEILEPATFMKYALICVPILFVALLVFGIPFSNIVF